MDDEFPDTDADTTADCKDVETCDGLDNDGNGVADDVPDQDADGWSAWSTIRLGDEAGQLVIEADEPLDELTWVGATTGAAWALDPRWIDGLGPWWCDATTPIAREGDDLGSPGVANNRCADADVDGDGGAELAVSAVNDSTTGRAAGAVHVVPGAATGDHTVTEGSTWFGEEAGDSIGTNLAAGDVDGDGLGDLAIGAWTASPSGEWSGITYLVHPATSGASLIGSAAFAALEGEAADDYFGQGLVGDVDGDGTDDLAVGAYGRSDLVASGGSAFLFLGPIDGGTTLDDAATRWSGVTAREYSGVVLAAADLDGDAVPELLLQFFSSVYAGVCVASASERGELAVDEGEGCLVADEAGDYAGWAIATPGDVDGDGYGDALVSAPYHDVADVGTYAGRVYLVTGPVDGDGSLGDSPASWDGAEDWDCVGTALTGTGDQDATDAPTSPSAATTPRPATGWPGWGPAATGAALTPSPSWMRR